ncbi:aquaporin [Xylariaceae sp. FL0804]|nr:aquaporin [Xylariaceae sp. FL0804]
MEQAQLPNHIRLPWQGGEKKPPQEPFAADPLPSTSSSSGPAPGRRSFGFRRRPDGLVPPPMVHRKRVRALDFLPLAAKNHVIAVMSEFCGTFMFLLFAFGGTNAVNSAPAQPADLAADPAKLLFISLCFGMSLMVNAWVFFRISGGLFNPAVTLGMMVIGAVGYLRGALVMVGQLLGAIAAAAVVLGIQPKGIHAAVALGGGTTPVQGLFIEMFLTIQLVFTIFMLAAEKHRGTFIAPVGIGLSLFICELMGVYYTGGALNPARAFGPAVVTGRFHSYHWIYWVGPILGSLVASGFYITIKALEYETVNPGQDEDSDEKQLQQRRPSRVSGDDGALRPAHTNTTGSGTTYAGSPDRDLEAGRTSST